MSQKEKACFGFYLGGVVCGQCIAAKRCKAILVSDGFDLAAALVEQLSNELPDVAEFRDSDRVSDLVEQLLKPPAKGAKADPEREELLDLLEKNGIDEEIPF